MTAPIRRARINHMELTVATGTLTALMPELLAFYGGALGFGQCGRQETAGEIAAPGI